MLDAFEPDLDQLVAANREQLIPIAQQVAKTESWSLSLRCAVIDCSSGLPKVHNSSVGGIGSFICTSTVIDHPLMEHFLALVNSQGVDAALDAMTNDLGESDEFNTLYDAYLEERQQGQLMWGAGDATEFVMKSQDCFQDREMACIAVFPSEPQPELYTFALPLFSLAFKTETFSPCLATKSRVFSTVVGACGRPSTGLPTRHLGGRQHAGPQNISVASRPCSLP